jgi:hypothetical protein
MFNVQGSMFNACYQLFIEHCSLFIFSRSALPAHRPALMHKPPKGAAS